MCIWRTLSPAFGFLCVFGYRSGSAIYHLVTLEEYFIWV